MEQFFTNPGLVHIGEKIFQNLDYQSLVICQNVCQTWKIILENPDFWIKSFVTVPKIILQQENASSSATENKNSNHETSAAAEWDYLIKNTFETSLKSNVLKVVIAQKETEKFIRSPLYMALKVKDLDLINHLLSIFLKKTENDPTSWTFSKNTLAENIKESKIKCLEAVLEALESMHVSNLVTPIIYDNEQEVGLMKTLIQHILRNFPSNSYMDRYTFVYQLDCKVETAGHGPTNFIKLIKESFTSQAKP